MGGLALLSLPGLTDGVGRDLVGIAKGEKTLRRQSCSRLRLYGCCGGPGP